MTLDTTNEIKNAKPKMKAKPSCFKCLAVSDLENTEIDEYKIAYSISVDRNLV